LPRQLFRSSDFDRVIVDLVDDKDNVSAPCIAQTQGGKIVRSLSDGRPADCPTHAANSYFVTCNLRDGLTRPPAGTPLKRRSCAYTSDRIHFLVGDVIPSRNPAHDLQRGIGRSSGSSEQKPPLTKLLVVRLGKRPSLTAALRTRSLGGGLRDSISSIRRLHRWRQDVSNVVAAAIVDPPPPNSTHSERSFSSDVEDWIGCCDSQKNFRDGAGERRTAENDKPKFW